MKHFSFITFFALGLFVSNLVGGLPSSVQAASIGRFEQNQYIERIANELLARLQGSPEYNREMRPLLVQASRLNPEFVEYLQEVHQFWQTVSAADNTPKNRGQQRLELEFFTKNIIREATQGVRP